MCTTLAVYFVFLRCHLIKLLEKSWACSAVKQGRWNANTDHCFARIGVTRGSVPCNRLLAALLSSNHPEGDTLACIEVTIAKKCILHHDKGPGRPTSDFPLDEEHESGAMRCARSVLRASDILTTGRHESRRKLPSLDH